MNVSIIRLAAQIAKEPKRLKFVRNLPWYAQAESVPVHWKWFGRFLVLPLAVGGISVHIIPLIIRNSSSLTHVEENETVIDRARNVMGWTLHYASVLVAAQSALHWGMQAFNMGLPTHTVEFTPLYRFMRFGLPVVPLTVAILASRLSIEDPRAAAVALMCVQSLAVGGDFFAYAFATCPVWFVKYNFRISLGIIGSLLILMLSERMKLRGQLELIKDIR